MIYQTALIFAYFFIYAVIGWICEVIYCSIPQKRFVNRGFLNGPYCPIYGVGAVVVIGMLTPWAKNPLAVFVVGIIVTSALEYFTSWAMEKLFHAKWWDYSDQKFNIHGRVCLKNSTLFGLLCLALMYLVHPLTRDLIALLSPLALEIAAAVVFVLMTADLVSSTLETINLTQKIKRVSAVVSEAAEELRARGVETKEQLAHRIAMDRENREAFLGSARDDLSQTLADIAGRLSEKAALRRYSHKRLLRAFPNMISHIDPASVKIYRETIRNRDYFKKLRKKQRRQHKASRS
ncbi:MAG: hypothetical protein Q4C55_08595 [Eubacterium sp.]|nr:hypothetical protein [Eubacterium sp.]